MLTLKWIDLHCPVCASVFESMAASSADDEGHGYYIDPSTPVSTGIAMLPFLVHTCHRCGYTGAVSDFGEDVEITDDLRTRVWAEYRLGELWTRIGDLSQANAWFDRAGRAS